MADPHEDQICYKCQKPITDDEVHSFSGNPWCRSCYYTGGELGPLAEQYKKCPKCGETVHNFTIRCQHCLTPTHETGTIRVQKPIRSSVIMAYGIIALIMLVMAFTIPGFSDKGWISWIASVIGCAIAAHGLLGLMFQFLPFGLTTLRRTPALLVGLAQTLVGGLLLLWPIL